MEASRGRGLVRFRIDVVFLDLGEEILHVHARAFGGKGDIAFRRAKA